MNHLLKKLEELNTRKIHTLKTVLRGMTTILKKSLNLWIGSGKIFLIFIR